MNRSRAILSRAVTQVTIAAALLASVGLIYSQDPAAAGQGDSGQTNGGPGKGGNGGGKGNLFNGSDAPFKGKMEKIAVHGKSLEGNLEGDSADRDVLVYLPPSYASTPNRRYPVVYFLHGYGVGAEAYWNMMTVPQSVEAALAAGAKEMIVVLPDSFTVHNGSMYSNSPTTGNWEGYVIDDLIPYIDGHYRTIATRASRGLAGHSMGGYGAFRIGMKFPDVFVALYPMSSCCLMNDPNGPLGGGAGAGRGGPGRGGPAPGRGGATGAPQAPGNSAAPAGAPPNARPAVANAAPPAAGNTPPTDAAKGKGKGKGGGTTPALAAAWSSNPNNPPDYYDLPVQDGVYRPEIGAKWYANSPLAMVDQYWTNLKKYKAIKMDVGLQDGLMASNKQMDESLTRLGIPHVYETYEGDHTNHVRDRFEQSVIPFFSQNLEFPK